MPVAEADPAEMVGDAANASTKHAAGAFLVSGQGNGLPPGLPWSVYGPAAGGQAVAARESLGSPGRRLAIPAAPRRKMPPARSFVAKAIYTVPVYH